MEETQKMNREASVDAFSLTSQILDSLEAKKASASDLAETLNVPIKQVYNAVSALKRSDKIHVAELAETDRNTTVSIYAAGAAPAKAAKAKTKSKKAKSKKAKVHKAKAPTEPMINARNTAEGVLLVLANGPATTEEIAQRLHKSISNVHRVLCEGEDFFVQHEIVGRAMTYALTRAGTKEAKALGASDSEPVRLPRKMKISPLFYEFLEVQKEIEIIEQALAEKTARRDEILALVDA